MSSLAPVIAVDPAKCTNCHACIAACPVKFCNDASGDHVNVIADLCIGCGSCIDACTHDARKGIDDFDRWLKAAQAGERMVAIAAPAIAANFPDTFLNLNGWLQTLGVAAVFDVSFGAELTVQSYLDYAVREKPPTIIAQPCPAIVSFVEIYHPELIPHLAPADSPMVHTIKMIREYYPGFAAHKILVLSPCLAKRREFDATGHGDYNVTYKAIIEYQKREGINLKSFPEVGFTGHPAERAVLFSTPGGLMRTVEREAEGVARRTRKIEGPHVIYDYLEKLPKMIAAGHAPILIDCLSCEMGCNGGPGTVNRQKSPDEIEARIEARNEQMRALYRKQGFRRSPQAARRRVRRAVSKFWKRGLYGRRYLNLSANNVTVRPNNREFEQLYQRMHKFETRDFLNCGACGYGRCELMATAIHNGLNNPSNCFHYERARRQEMTATLIEDIRTSTERLTVALGRITAKSNGDGQETVSIQQIAEISRGMRSSIESGLGLIDRTITTMEEIRTSNHTTADRMRVLAEQIQSISEIVGMISAIADQTKIIAFNAELEASAAGETGRSFEIVAAEIRRLANSTVSSTARIKEKIAEIQTSSRQVAESATRESADIKGGAAIAGQLRSVFGELAHHSAQTDSKISASIEAQIAAFEGTLQELSRIGAHVDGFEGE